MVTKGEIKEAIKGVEAETLYSKGIAWLPGLDDVDNKPE